MLGLDKTGRWAESIITKIEKGDLSGALASISAVREVKLPVGVPNLSAYLSNNRKRMNYNDLKQQGIKIGAVAPWKVVTRRSYSSE
jgi:hypothetical protein